MGMQLQKHRTDQSQDKDGQAKITKYWASRSAFKRIAILIC